MNAVMILENRYQLLTVIKRGGFGTVYKGYDNVLGKDIAVKEINPDLLKDDWYVDQFQNEAKHVAKMNHQNIVHIFDLVKTKDGKFFIVMEYIEGFDLSTLIKYYQQKGMQLPQHLSVHIIAEVCKALDYAHNCKNSDSHEPLNLVHQDISPSNIMISKTGGVKLIDFGIAGVQKPIVEKDDTVMLQGKAQYMSPEHVIRENTLDKRSDIFSLGLVLYEMLEGKRFFQHENTVQIIEALQNGKLKFKDTKHTPKPLQNVLIKALENSPDKRYQNANQVYIDLVTFLVLQADVTSIDSELAAFVNQLSGGTPPANTSEKTLGVRDADLLFDSVLEDIGGKPLETAPQNTIEKPPEIQIPIDKEESASSLQNGLSANETLPVPSPVLEPKPEGVPLPKDYFEAGDEIKTVIDVVRLSTRGHKKLVKRSLASVAGFTVLFFLLDIALQWTRVGAGVYDLLFPPTIKIASVPAGAKVFLNDKPLEGITPLAIDKIDPGIYELKLTLDRYKPIIKSLHIPGKGEAQIKGEQMRSGANPYTFKFKTSLALESVPPGADVFLNGIKYGQKTPCSVTWEVGDRCEIKMKRPGFEELSGFALAGENMAEEIEDRRLWSLERHDDPTMRYTIKALFGKFTTFRSNPSGAQIYLDGQRSPIGTTGSGEKYFLTAEKHKVTLRKNGYNARTVDFTIDQNSRSEFVWTLSRSVTFEAYDATNSTNKDLHATLVKLSRGQLTIASDKKTPFRMDLQPQQYVATFSKPGYQNKKVTVATDARTVTAKLSPSSGRFSVVVLEKQSRRPLSNVEVRYKSLEGRGAKEVMDVTDGEGTVSGMLSPGLYFFRTSKNGYVYQEQTVMINPANLTLIEFRLVKQ